jgi:hypothetical protein
MKPTGMIASTGKTRQVHGKYIRAKGSQNHPGFEKARNFRIGNSREKYVEF